MQLERCSWQIRCIWTPTNSVAMSRALYLLRFAADWLVTLTETIFLFRSTNELRFCQLYPCSRKSLSFRTVWLLSAFVSNLDCPVALLRFGMLSRLDWRSREDGLRAAPLKRMRAKGCRCRSPYTSSPFVRMYEGIDYERRFSIMIDSYCRLLDTRVLTKDEINGAIGFRAVNFPFDEA